MCCFHQLVFFLAGFNWRRGKKKQSRYKQVSHGLTALLLFCSLSVVFFPLFFDYNTPPECYRRIIFAIAAANSFTVSAVGGLVSNSPHPLYVHHAAHHAGAAARNTVVHVHFGQHGLVTANSW